MALRDEVKEQQDKLKGKSGKEKLQYFWDYYKIHTLVALFVLLMGGSFIKDIVTNKDTAYSAILLNAHSYDDQAAFQDDFAAYAGIDTNTYSCQLDTTATYTPDSMSQYDIAFIQRIMGMVQTRTLDTIIGDTAAFSHYAETMLFQDLREELSEEEYARYEPYFFYIDEAVIERNNALSEDLDSEIPPEPSPDPTNPSAMEKPIPVGIYLKNSSRLAQWNCYTATGETPIFGFVATSVNPERNHLFLEYLTSN